MRNILNEAWLGWQHHISPSIWGESLIYSAAFAMVALSVVLLLMQNGRWQSSTVSALVWSASAIIVTKLTQWVCGDIMDIALPFCIAALLSIAFRIYIDRLTVFGVGLVFSLTYIGCCVTLYLGQLARNYLVPEDSLFLNSMVYFIQAFSIILSAGKLTTSLVEVPLGICLKSPKRDEAESTMRALRGKTSPLVSIHVPCYSEPSELVIATLNAIAHLNYKNFEVLVVDNNTKDPELWKPVEAHCRKLGNQFRFFHVDPLAGAKAGAVNFALKCTHPAAEIVCIVDADYIVEADFLDRYIPLFSNPKIGYVQLSHDYHRWETSQFLTAAYQMYVNFHKISLPNFCEYDAGFTVGTMCLLRRKALEDAGGWAEWCLTEDSEVAVRIHALGYSGHSLGDTGGRGLIPETFEGMKKQWFRWAAGPVQQLQHHWRMYFGLRPSKLTFGQRANEIMHSFSHLPHFYDFFVSLFVVPILIAVIIGIYGKPLPAVTPGVLIYLLLSSVTIWIVRWVNFNYFNLYVPNNTDSFRGIKGLRTFAISRLIISALHWTYIIASIAPFFKHRFTWFRTDKFNKSFSLVRALNTSSTETTIAVVHFLVGFLLLPFARFSPLDYTALAVIWEFWNGVGFLSPLCISLYSELAISKDVPSGLQVCANE